MHTKNSASVNARLYRAVYSNAKIILDGLPVAYEDLPGVPRMRRNTKVLSEQFRYRYGITADHLCSHFTAWFRGSFVVAGLINDRDMDTGSG